MPKAVAKKPTKKGKYSPPIPIQQLKLTTSPDRGDEALQPSTDGMPCVSISVENQLGEIETTISQMFENFD